MPLLIPAALFAIGIIGSIHGASRVVHPSPGDAISSAMTGVLGIGWPFFAAGKRYQRSRSTEGVTGDPEGSPGAAVRTPGQGGWFYDNGRWYCEAHNTRDCKICSS